MLFENIFANKKVLITGHTGFKGSWLSIWLNSIGANVIGCSIDVPSEPSHFMISKLDKCVDDNRIDIRDKISVIELFTKHKPDFVFHLAAQALVRHSYNNPSITYETNVIGTLNILEALRQLDNRCIAVLITSDKCYDNKEWVWGYRETDNLGGPDPYSASKGAAELIIRSHVKSFFPVDGKIRIAIGRAGNVIGGGDWAIDRIIPDCIRSWTNGKSVKLRNPNSTRPWQHVLEPLSGYLALACNLSVKQNLHGEPFNFGPHLVQNYSVLDLIKHMSIHWDLVKWENVLTKDNGMHESELLKLNCDKALHNLSWYSILNFEETVRFTIDWYHYYYENPNNIKEKSIEQIIEYTKKANNKGIKWALPA
jgi:CDP-glucose 4,6-dehydratase